MISVYTVIIICLGGREQLLLIVLIFIIPLQKIHHYVSELNNLESRKGRKPLDVNNVVYWFKNARAAQKRAEVRGTNSG